MEATITGERMYASERQHGYRIAWLRNECFLAGGAAAVAVAGRVVLRIRLHFHNHTPQQLAIRFLFHQQAADELGCNLLGGAGEEGWGERLKVMGGRGGYGSGFGAIVSES